jgi:hypothetical protein
LHIMLRTLFPQMVTSSTSAWPVLKCYGCSPLLINITIMFPTINSHHKWNWEKQGITNTLALPIDKMFCIYLLCPHSEHQNNPFRSEQSKHFHPKNRFIKCETGSNNVKLPKVGSNAILPVPPRKNLEKYLNRHQNPLLMDTIHDHP